jgi:hypothetical protein
MGGDAVETCQLVWFFMDVFGSNCRDGPFLKAAGFIYGLLL